MQGLYRTLSPVTLSSAKDPAGYPDKNSNNRKIESAQGTMGRGKSGSEAFLLSFPFPSSPARFLFLSLQSSLQYQEASAEERGPVMIDNDLANDHLLFTVMWFTAEKVRRYKFIVCLFFFYLCHINTQGIEITHQVWISATFHICTHLWMTPFWCKYCKPVMISAV